MAGGSTQTGALFLPASTENSTNDLDGNLTSDGRWTTILWDAENRLIEMRRDTAPDSARLKVTFTYDWMGRRVRKTTYTWNGTGWTQASDSKFLYDDWNVTAELDGSTGIRKRTFMWGLDLSGSEQGAGGVGGLIKVSDFTASQIDRFAVYDGNGNVTGLTSAVDGSLTARYEYGPFGEIERASGPDARSNCIRFSSKWQDDETGYLYYGYRYYDPGVGRWLGRDPISERGGLNIMSLANQDPINGFDSLGVYVYDEKTRTFTMEPCEVLIVYGHGSKGKPYKFKFPHEGGCVGVVTCFSNESIKHVPSDKLLAGQKRRNSRCYWNAGSSIVGTIADRMKEDPDDETCPFRGETALNEMVNSIPECLMKLCQKCTRVKVAFFRAAKDGDKDVPPLPNPDIRVENCNKCCLK